MKKLWSENLKGRNHLNDLSVYGQKILDWQVLVNMVNEPLGSIKGGEFIDSLSYHFSEGTVQHVV